MELRTAILERRSVRVLRPEPVPEEAIAAMKEAILWAPSAGHLQSRRFWFVTDPEKKTAIGACTYQPEIFRGAALVVVGCTDGRITGRYGERGLRLYAPQDVAASVQNLLLTVHALGLGAVWIGAFEPGGVREVLSLEPRFEAVVLVPVGTPEEHPAPGPRLSDGQAFVMV